MNNYLLRKNKYYKQILIQKKLKIDLINFSKINIYK